MVRNYIQNKLRYFSLLCFFQSILLLQGLCVGSNSANHHVADLERSLCKLGSGGQLSDVLVAEFYHYSMEKAKEQIPASDHFWNWLSQNKQIQQGLLVGLHPDYNPNVVKNLQDLKSKFGAQVEQYPHLALAFAFVYGAAKDNIIRPSGLQSWVGKNRDIPSCSESFAYLIHEKEQLYYLPDQFPWPLMLYVADNDTPLSERQWVMDRYSGYSIKDFRRLHTEVKHVKGASAKRRAALPGTPMALPQLKRDGGVCSQQSYYASRVLKSLGVPSIRLTVPDHAYEGWVVDGQKLKFVVGGALGRQNADFFCPLTREKNKQYKFNLLVSSIDLSYDKYLRSRIACHVFRMLPDDLKRESMDLLNTSIETNPYVIESWVEYARACEEGVFPLKAGWTLFDQAANLLSHYPELDCAILTALTKAQLNTEGEISDAQFHETQKRFEKTLKKLIVNKRLDLGIDLFTTHADYLARTKSIDVVVDNALQWFELKNFALNDEKILFKHVLHIALELNDNTALEKLLHTEFLRRRQLVPESTNSLYDKHYSGLVQVVRSYITYCKNTGNYTKASELYLELDRFKKENLNLNDLRDVVNEGRTLGANQKQVVEVNPKAQGCYVWRILYNLPKGLKIRVRSKHAASGKKGAFYYIAWTDKDRNGVPDTKVAMSPLMTAQKDQWSQWEFTPTEQTIFVGIAMKTKNTIYYQMNEQVDDLYGLSNRVFYSSEFDQQPVRSAQPRYSSVCVEILRQ